jgi:hypothetical protein
MADDKSKKAIDFAEKQVGKPYVWGATGPSSYDCSGLVYAAYRHAGVKVARTTYGQIHNGKAVKKKDLQPGDLIFPTPSYDHVQIYKGDGKIVEAARPGVGVRNSNVTTVWAARRVTSGGGGKPKGEKTPGRKPDGKSDHQSGISGHQKPKGGSDAGGNAADSRGNRDSVPGTPVDHPWFVAGSILALGYVLNEVM